MKKVKVLTAPPTDAVDTSSAYFWLDKDGIIVIRYKSAGQHDIEQALENVKVTTKLAEGISRPLLVDMTNIKSMSREARQRYVEATGPGKIIKAVALVTKSVAGRIIANFFLSFNKPPAPLKVFSDSATAKEWLKKYI